MQPDFSTLKPVQPVQSEQPDFATLKPVSNVPPQKPGILSQIGSNLKQTFQQGASDITSAIQNQPKIAASISPQGQPGALEQTLSAGSTLGHIAGTVAGTAGGILGSIIAPILPEAVKGKVGDIAHYVDTKILSIPGMTPEIHKSLGDILNTVSLLGGKEVSPTIGETTGAIKNVGSELANKVSAGIAENAAQKATQTAIEAVTPKMTGKTLANHYMQDFGKEAQQAGLLNPQKAAINPQIERVASNLQDVLTSKNPLTNLKNLGADMTKTESKLGSLLSSDKTPIIKQDITEQLNGLKQQIPQEFQAIKDQKNVFTRVINYANSIVDKMSKESSGTLNDLRNSRIKFDTQAKLEFPSAFKNGVIDVSTPAGRAIKLVRDTMNENLYSRTPNGSQLQSLVKREADIFKAAQNIAPKVAGNEGKSILERVVGQIKRHPIITGIGAYEAAKHILP